MFIQIKDLNQEIEPKTEGVFYISSNEDPTLYISRSFVGHELEKFTSSEFENAIVYFNRQQAENALATDFKFTTKPWKITRIPINADVKDSAKKADAVKRHLKNERRRLEKEQRMQNGSNKRN